MSEYIEMIGENGQQSENYLQSVLSIAQSRLNDMMVKSINDEARQMIAAGNVEPIVINQNSGTSNQADEIQHSAIANSASPFKDWMYVEPYA